MNRPGAAAFRTRPRPAGLLNQPRATASLGPHRQAGLRNPPGLAAAENLPGVAAPPGPLGQAGSGVRSGARCSRLSGGIGCRRSPSCRWLTTRRPRPAAGLRLARHPPVPASGRSASCCAGRSQPGKHWRTQRTRSAGWPVAGTGCVRDARPASRRGCWPRHRIRGTARGAARGPSGPSAPRSPPTRRSAEDDDHRGREQPAIALRG